MFCRLKNIDPETEALNEQFICVEQLALFSQCVTIKSSLRMFHEGRLSKQL